MRACTWLLVAVLAGQPLSAQTVVQPDQPLDSTQVTLRDALLVLRDSLVTIDGAAGRLQRDYRQTSGPSLLSRARVMRDACARSVRTIRPTRTAILSVQLSNTTRSKGRTRIVGALDTLRGFLTRCEKDFSEMSQPEKAETVRGYGNDRAVQVQGAIRRYERTMQEFLGLMGIKVAPLGAPASALAQ